jgi:hypothetical protein
MQKASSVAITRTHTTSLELTTMEPAAWSSSLPQPLADIGASWQSSSDRELYQAMAIVIGAVVAIGYLVRSTTIDSKRFPTINPAHGVEVLGKARRQDFFRNALSYFDQGVNLFPGKPFKVLADHGDLTVLPASWAHDIRNEPNLSFMKSVHEDFHADFAPFQPFASGTSDDALLQAVARKQLTKYLSELESCSQAFVKSCSDKLLM